MSLRDSKYVDKERDKTTVPFCYLGLRSVMCQLSILMLYFIFTFCEFFILHLAFKNWYLCRLLYLYLIIIELSQRALMYATYLTETYSDGCMRSAFKMAR